ncbi:MAG: AAA family ATPase, partial [Sphaerochaetaceae bacterium]
SKGMQQKLSIVCALAHKPKFVLFDEPIVGLDPHAIKEIKSLFRELKDQGATLLISTHMIDSVEDYWDEVNILVKGKIAASRTKEELDKKNENLEDLFFSITEGKNNE